jgi:L-glutamine---4-(methylsulfanyl)-2-oxobutanoate aminotransferase
VKKVENLTIYEPSQIIQQLPKQFFANLVKQVSAKVAQGHDVINLGQGNPDLPTPAHIVEKMQEAVQNPLNHKYAPFRGFDYLKEAVATFYKQEYGVKIDPKHEVAVLFGGKAGLVQLPICLLNPGDIALLPDPGYPDYLSGLAMARASYELMPLREESQFLPEFDFINPHVLEKAKLMFLNYPNNPTGATADLSFFEETVRLAEKHRICVVHDFAYGAIGFDGQKPISFLQAEGAKEVGIEIYTLSKTYNMAGWRVAFAIGNRSVIQALEQYQDHMYVSLFGAIQEAAAHALLSSQQAVRDLVQTYEKRRNTLIEAAHQIGWNVTQPKGTFFAWLNVPNGYTSMEFFKLLLEKAHVAVAPGVGFGQYGEGYVRVGLLAEEKRLVEAIERMDALRLFKS